MSNSEEVRVCRSCGHCVKDQDFPRTSDGLLQTRWCPFCHYDAFRDVLIETARQARESRVQDAEKDPLGAYVTLLQWFVRWEWARLRRHFLHKSPWMLRDKDGLPVLVGASGDIWCKQEMKFAYLRDKVLVEGCRLGASPVEMGRVLDEAECIPWILTRWDKNTPKTKDEAEDRLEKLLIKCWRRETPLYDLMTWKQACKGNALSSDGPASEHPSAVIKSRLSRQLRRLFEYIYNRSDVKIEDIQNALGHTDKSHTYTQISRLRTACAPLPRSLSCRLVITTNGGLVSCHLHKNTAKTTDS